MPQTADHVYLDLVAQHGTPLFVVNCARVGEQFQTLKRALPNCKFYYALKAFCHPNVIKTLDDCGAGFDIASSGEISILQDLGINARKTIHTHPIKKHSEIVAALRYGTTTFVIDNIHELEKFVPYRHRVGLLLRVSFRNSNAKVDLSRKFGCTADEAHTLLERAAHLGIHVKGLSFHVGSQSQTADMHTAAIGRCVEIMDFYSEVSQRPMTMLDIGGGFPAGYDNTVADIISFCAPIREALAGLNDRIDVIAEPGRFLVASAAVSITSVMGMAMRGDKMWYYMDDGVYGVYSGQIFDHALYPVRVLQTDAPADDLKPAVIAGPTCDSIDVIRDEIDLPALQIGDLLIGEMMGAYTAASATSFNLLPQSKTVIINE